jgi:hypothetical protein
MTVSREDAAHDESRPLQRDVRLHAVDYAVCDSEMMPEAATPGTAPAWGSKSTAPELDPGTARTGDAARYWADETEATDPNNAMVRALAK